MSNPAHIPVLLPEVLASLAPAPGEVYADCTAGLGGHAAAVAHRLGPGGTVILNDLDAGNLAAAGERVSQTVPGIRLVSLHGNFAQIPYAAENAGLAFGVLLADLGFASLHVDRAERGFSFGKEGPLDMRMDQSKGVTAAELVASMNERELAEMIAEFGEERQAGRIARKLVQERARTPITTTTHLAELIRGIVGWGAGGGIDPATRTFQAFRIAVNDEIGSIGALLAAITADGKRLLRDGRGRWLSPGARIGFLTFHSLEDRPVKRAFAELVSFGAADMTGGHVMATEAEMAVNPRARSAKLRVVRL